MMENCYGNGLHERLNAALPKISQKTHIKIPSLLLLIFFFSFFLWGGGEYWTGLMLEKDNFRRDCTPEESHQFHIFHTPFVFSLQNLSSQDFVKKNLTIGKGEKKSQQKNLNPHDWNPNSCCCNAGTLLLRNTKLRVSESRKKETGRLISMQFSPSS